jgi:hypothetical protein
MEREQDRVVISTKMGVDTRVRFGIVSPTVSAS